MRNDRETMDDLPGFLDESQETGADLEAEGALEAGTGEEPDFDEPPDEDPADYAESRADAPPAIPLAPQASGGVAAAVLGSLLVLGGIALAPLYEQGLLNRELESYGLAPSTVLLVGCLLVGLSAIRRQGSRAARGIEAALRERDEAERGLRERIEALLSSQTDGAASPIHESSMQELLNRIHRQDERLANLTRAVKMYGKPLMEISNQCIDTASAVSQVRERIEASGKSLAEEIASVRASLEQRPDSVPLIENLAQKIAQSENRLLHQMTRIEALVQAVTQRLEDSELRKSVLRLEEVSEQMNAGIRALAEGGSPREVSRELSQVIESAISRLAESVAEIRNDNLSPLENCVRDIQREMTGVATAVAGIRQSLRNPAPQGAAPVPPPAQPAASPAESAPFAAAASPAREETRPASGYQTGVRKAGSKSVLSAIARLRQMKQ
ncbi:MAG: hypothetical protein Fur0037_19560 [Planctomycetota bacterium]